MGLLRSTHPTYSHSGWRLTIRNIATGPPFAVGSQQRRDFTRVFVVDRVFVAADAIGIRMSGGDGGQRLRQCPEIAGELQPAVPHPARRSGQHPEAVVIVLGHPVEIGGDLDRDATGRDRLVARDLNAKSLVTHPPSLYRRPRRRANMTLRSVERKE